MKRIIKQNQAFESEQLPPAEALERIEGMGEPYKREYAEELIAKKGLEGLTFYRNGPFLDMCDGPHVTSTKQIPLGGFKLRSVAGAYWRGDSDRETMTPDLRMGLPDQGGARGPGEGPQGSPGPATTRSWGRTSRSSSSTTRSGRASPCGSPPGR